MTDKGKIGIVVLAAGSSSRMGALKQILKLGKYTLLSSVLTVAMASKYRPIVLVLGYEAQRITQSLPVEIVREISIVQNQDYAVGISTSIQAGIASLPADCAVFVLMGDQPLLTLDVLEQIAAKHRESGGKSIVPLYHGRFANPALLSVEMISKASELNGDQGFKAFLKGDGVDYMNIEDSHRILDADTQEDYEQIHDIYRRSQHEN